MNKCQEELINLNFKVGILPGINKEKPIPHFGNYTGMENKTIVDLLILLPNYKTNLRT